MTWFDGLVVVLRSLVYVGSICVAGSVLFAATFPNLADARSLQRQIAFGCVLLILVEPLRYVVFQLTAMGGDLTMAMGPEQRWIGMQTAFGKASLVRVIAAFLMLIAGRRVKALAGVSSFALIGSFLLEGHTASKDSGSLLLSVLLAVHLFAVHWWLGSLYPLRHLVKTSPESAAAVLSDFGRRATWMVAALVVAGALMLASLVGWMLDPASAYQQRFAAKILLVLALLCLAAANKIWLTPRLVTHGATHQIRASIGAEIAVALLILLATAFVITVAPVAMTHG